MLIKNLSRTFSIFLFSFLLSLNAHAGFRGLPVIASSPETGLQYGVLLIQSLEEEAVDGKLSSIQYIAINSTEDQQRLVVRPTIYMMDYKLELTPVINYSSFPEKYYGVGNDTLEDNEEDFTSEYLFLKMQATYNFYSDFYVLLRGTRDDREITEFETGGQIDLGLLSTGSQEQEYLLKSQGYGLIWDTRDIPRYPDSGYYAEVSTENFKGGIYDYDEDTIDLRAFISVGEKQVVAAHALKVEQEGDIPFLNLATIGGSDLVRGIFEGRYRSTEMEAAQLEFRKYGYEFLAWDAGITAFAAAGKVKALPGEDDSLHTGVGIGGHFFFAPEDRTTIRFDIAYGDGETGVYLMIDQAF